MQFLEVILKERM